MLTRAECLEVLKLDESAGPNAIKKSYRKLAFELHPDLNPDLPNAAKRFQELNEAYVLLMQEYANTSFSGTTKQSYSKQAGAGNTQRNGGQAGTNQGQKSEADEKTRDEAHKAYAQAKNRFDAQSSSEERRTPGAAAGATKNQGREEILRDLLNDPFARRVFEDIYSHARHNVGKTGNSTEKPPPRPAPKKIARAHSKNKQPAVILAGSKVLNLASSLKKGLKSWMRRQIDDEQVMFLPGEQLVPGARLRLQISHGLSGGARTIEITLPPEFKEGRPVRLRGLGKHLGGLQGDLYLRIYSREELEK